MESEARRVGGIEMDWKDTVMKREQLGTFWINPDECDDVGIAESQAEITWDIAYKAGYKQREKDPLDKEDRCEMCIIQGRKEVVELLLANADYECEDEDGDTCITFWFKPKVWKKQLEEWGIDG